jgi:hypothetical protein
LHRQGGQPVDQRQKPVLQIRLGSHEPQIRYASVPLEISLTAVDGLRLVGLSLLVGAAAGALSVRSVVWVDPAAAFANA